jgi:hypothetical protein
MGEGSCGYTEKAVADRRQGVLLQFGSWNRGLTTPHLKKNSVLRYVTRDIRIVQALVNSIMNLWIL